MKKYKKRVKPEYKVLKDSNKDFMRNSIIYPRHKSKIDFNGLRIEFSDYETHSFTDIKIKDKINIPKNRWNYGMGFKCQDGTELVLDYKLDSKGKMVITGLEFIH